MCGGGGIGKAVGNAFSGIGKAVSGVVSGVGKALGSVAKSPIFQAIAPIALNYFLPGIGTAVTGALNLSASWAPALGGALTGGIMGGLGGGGKGALKGALIGGLASGVADYAMTGNNPLSGMFSGTQGGAAANPLTAGGTGSTNLTGLGSGLGTSSSTLGTQFGQLNPGSGALGGASNVLGDVGSRVGSGSSALGGLKNTGASLLNAAPKPTGFFGNLKAGNLLEAGKSLIPSSTAGKVGLGLGALNLMGGIGGSKQPAGGGAPPPIQDPTFNQRLQKLDFNYNPTFGAQSRPGLQDYGVNYSYYNPQSGRFEQRGQNQNQNEQRFFTPGFSPPGTAPAAAGGGMMPGPSMGGLAQYASGGMPDVETAHGYLQGPGDGVSDDIPAVIGDNEPARLAGGEFIIPSRIVSELGNGSSDAGAQRLHQMMERVNSRRLKTKDFAKDSKAYNLLPA